MTKAFWPIFLALSLAAQTTTPTLSTADRTAIAACEQRKQAASKEFQDAQQTELAIEREWQAAHPGYAINPQTFAVEAVAKPEAPKEKK